MNSQCLVNVPMQYNSYCTQYNTTQLNILFSISIKTSVHDTQTATQNMVTHYAPLSFSKWHRQHGIWPKHNTFIVLIKPIPYICTMLHHTHIYINIPYSDYKWLLIEHRKEFCWSACHVSLLLTVLNKAAEASLYCQLLIMYQ